MSKLKLPQFWYAHNQQPQSLLVAYLLLPFSWIYRFICLIDQSFTVRNTSSLPVICVGNLTMGGGGKTPTARMINEIVKEHGKFATPCFLMRGYKGNFSGAMEVNPSTHTTWDVGDEALMQVRYAPVIVAKDRKKGSQLAAKRGYDIIIMDDGFQNFSLKKNLSIIVIDGGFGFGNGLCFPSGPLREPVRTGIQRAHAALVINRDDNTKLPDLGKLRQYDASLSLHVVENKPTDNDDKKSVIAFAGIARPEKFFQTLEENRFQIHSQFNFGDHHIYTHDQLNHMYKRAVDVKARLITTEKDWIKLSKSWQQKIDHIKISVNPDDGFKSFINKVLDRL